MLRELEEYLAKKGWEVKQAPGDQTRVQECPICGDMKWHFYIDNETGMWHCHSGDCQESGNLLTLKRQLGDLDLVPTSMFKFAGKKKTKSYRTPRDGVDGRYHQQLLADDKAMDYLTKQRGFSVETIKKLVWGLYIHKDGSRWWAIPSYKNGKLVNFKYKTLPPAKKNFRRFKGGETTLYNCDCLATITTVPKEDRVVYITESETDAAALLDMGCKFVVASSAGAGSFKDNWIPYLDKAAEIVICFDSDNAGGLGSKKLADRLGKYRCKRAIPELKDFAEVLESGLGKKSFEKSLNDARAYDDSSVQSIMNFADELRAKLFGGNPKGKHTGWNNLDNVWGGFRENELTIITGDTGSGKSTWTTAFAFQRVLQGENVLIAPFEEKPVSILEKTLAMNDKRSIYDLDQRALDASLKRLPGDQIFMIDCYGSTSLQSIKDAIYFSYHRYGITLAVLDHLHMFLDIRRPSEERFRIEEAVKACKQWTVDLPIHIFLVCHPQKLTVSDEGRTRKVVMNDLKGSSAIKQWTDNVIRVTRDRQVDVQSTGVGETEISIMKCRSTAGNEGSCDYSFNIRTLEYSELVSSQTNAAYRSRAASKKSSATNEQGGNGSMHGSYGVNMENYDDPE